MAMTEDFTLFFDTAEFADAAVHTPAAGGTGTPGTLIFDENGLVLEEYDVQTVGPTATCARSQWPSVREGDTVTVSFDGGAISYRLRAVTPLGDGKLLLLQLVRHEPGAGITPGQLLLDGSYLLHDSNNLVFA